MRDIDRAMNKEMRGSPTLGWSSGNVGALSAEYAATCPLLMFRRARFGDSSSSFKLKTNDGLSATSTLTLYRNLNEFGRTTRLGGYYLAAPSVARV